MNEVKEWYVYTQGELVGPVVKETVVNLLQLGRLQWVEFAWTASMRNWERLSSIAEFSALLPPSPPIAPPFQTNMDHPDHDKNLAIESDTDAASSNPESTARTPKRRDRVRKTERVPIEGVIVIEGIGSFRLHNISESGAFVELPETINLVIGEIYKLQVQSEAFEKPIRLTATVVRSGIINGVYGVGLEFRGMTPFDFGMLRTYVRTKAFN